MKLLPLQKKQLQNTKHMQSQQMLNQKLKLTNNTTF